jgi:flagellar secretion chaperone FliS
MSQTNAKANQYLKTKVMSASPEELRLMLLDGALRFARQGRKGLEDKHYEVSYENIVKAKDIVLELINILRPDVDPELCSKLSALYTFMYKRLTDANMQHELKAIDEVIDLLEYERETWVLLMERIRSERAAAPQQASATAADADARPRLSIEG